MKTTDFTEYYNLACAYSLQGLTSKAAAYLEMSIKRGFKDYNGAMNDEDLTNVRKTDAFAALMKKYFQKEPNPMVSKEN